MDTLEKKIYYNKLLSLYGDLLSSSQKNVLDDYFNFDLSISEIAENRNISRSAVEDAIKKGKKKLDEYEEVILLYKNKSLILEKINEYKKNKNESLISEIEEIINGI